MLWVSAPGRWTKINFSFRLSVPDTHSTHFSVLLVSSGGFTEPKRFLTEYLLKLPALEIFNIWNFAHFCSNRRFYKAVFLHTFIAQFSVNLIPQLSAISVPSQFVLRKFCISVTASFASERCVLFGMWMFLTPAMSNRRRTALSCIHAHVLQRWAFWTIALKLEDSHSAIFHTAQHAVGISTCRPMHVFYVDVDVSGDFVGALFSIFVKDIQCTLLLLCRREIRNQCIHLSSIHVLWLCHVS